MKPLVITILLIGSLTGCVSWNREQKVAFTANALGQAADSWQSSQFMQNGFHEGNPAFQGQNREPRLDLMTATKLLWLGVLYLYIDTYPEESSSTFLRAVTGATMSYVIWNQAMLMR